MAITITPSIAIATTRLTQTLTDSSIYGTGGNPARSACRVFVKGYKVSYENVATALTTTGNNATATTDSSWVITYDTDGFYRYYIVIVTDSYSAGTTYAQYDCTYSGDLVYRSKVAGNIANALSNTTYWEAITDVPALAANKGTSSESLNITSTSYLRVLSANSQYEYGNQLSDQYFSVDADGLEALLDYNIFAKMLDEVAIADSRSEVLDGELICRRIQTKFID